MQVDFPALFLLETLHVHVIAPKIFFFGLGPQDPFGSESPGEGSACHNPALFLWDLGAVFIFLVDFSPSALKGSFSGKLFINFFLYLLLLIL